MRVKLEYERLIRATSLSLAIRSTETFGDAKEDRDAIECGEKEREREREVCM